MQGHYVHLHLVLTRFFSCVHILIDHILCRSTDQLYTQYKLSSRTWTPLSDGVESRHSGCIHARYGAQRFTKSFCIFAAKDFAAAGVQITARRPKQQGLFAIGSNFWPASHFGSRSRLDTNTDQTNYPIK